MEAFHDGQMYQQFLVDRQGNLTFNKFGKSRTVQGAKVSSFEKFYYVLMKHFLDLMIGFRQGKGNVEGNNTGTEVALMAIVGDDNPLLEIPRNPGFFHELGFAGMFLQICLVIIPGPDLEPLGAYMAIFDLAYASRMSARRIRNIPTESGTGYFGFMPLLQRYYPRDFGNWKGVPGLVRQVLQTDLPETGRIESSSGTAICWVRTATALEGVVLGATILESRLDEGGKRDALFISLIWLGSLGIFVLAIRGFRGAILLPIRRLHDGATAIGDGDFGLRLPVETSDELGRLAGALNRMAESLQQQERMRRFISIGTWDSLETRDSTSLEGTRQHEAAVLFSDIRGFTTISEKSSPEQVIMLLNEYFTAMDKIIRRNGGMIDKLIGDAILAVFKPIPGADSPARRAVIAGLSIRAALSLFNRRRKREGAFPIDNGVGIHYGPVTEGMIGSSQGRRDLTVIGRTVTRASLLEGASKCGVATRVIVSPELAEHLGGEYPLLPVAGTDETLFEIDRPWTGPTS